MLFEDFIFDECYTDYDRLSDPNKDANGEGTHQRITKAIGSEIDDNLVPLVDDMQSNIFTSPVMFSKFIGHKESEAGYSKRWRSWFMSQTPAFRKNTVRIIDRLYRIRCTKLCHEIMFGWLGFGVTIVEIFGAEGFDTPHTFDVPLHTFDSSCPRCTTYEVYITGAGGSLTADEIVAITAVLTFNQPVDAQIADIFYNGVSVVDDFDQDNPDLVFDVYVPEDADALAFIDAAGITGTVTKRAIEILVVDLKSAGVWTKMIAVYPMVGGSATTCKYNLKDPQDLDASYRLTFFNSPTIDADGVAWNGTTQYANTYFIPASMPGDDMSMSYYSLSSEVATTRAVMGANVAATTAQVVMWLNNAIDKTQVLCYMTSTTPLFTKHTATDKGFFLAANTGTEVRVHQDGTAIGPQTQASANLNGVNIAMFLGARNVAGAPNIPTSMKCGFAHIGETLTNTEAVVFSDVVNSFMTRMGRNTY